MATIRLPRGDSLPATLIPPPPGLTSNFVDPQDQAYIVLVPAFVLAALSLVSLTARGYAAGIIVRKWGITDCECLLIFSQMTRMLTSIL